MSPLALAAEDRGVRAGITSGEKRVALVIGNSAYPSGALDNPRNDATAMAAALKRLGFDVELKINANKADFAAIQKRFNAKANKSDVAAVFYAGHGIQYENQNYLVPIDAKPQSAQDFKREMVKLEDIIDDMGNAKVKLVFFDACRDNPLARSFSRGGSRGMSAPNEAAGTLISFATKHGNTASDGSSSHSPYTEALLAALENPVEEVHALLRKKIQQSVKEKTKGQQEPWAYGNLNGDFYFIQGPVNVTVSKSDSAKPDPGVIELELWRGAQATKNIEAYEDYLAKYPQGQFAGQAKAAIGKLKGGTKTEAAALEPAPRTESRKTKESIQEPAPAKAASADSKVLTPKVPAKSKARSEETAPIADSSDGKPIAHPLNRVYRTADSIIVVFKNFPESKYCWIDISKKEDGDGRYRQYYWTNGKSSGQLTFSGLRLEPGSYEVRGHFSRSNTVDQRFPFRV
ncbi:MAG: caspase family protein, partial [Betaproteobacteria bacterium]